MIWHIFKKDFRLSWKFALLAALLQWIATALVVKLGISWPYDSSPHFAGLVRQAATLATCLVVVAAVHHDPLPSPMSDWLMRPIRRRDMLMAKILFFLIAVQLPVFIACVGEGLLFGLGFGNSMLAGLWQSAMLTLVFGIPVLALAAITTNLMEAIIATAVGFIVVLAISQLPSLGIGYRGGLGRMEWMQTLGLYGGMFLAGAAALAIQYHRRNTTRARLVSGVIFTLGAVAMILPWKTAFAVQQQISPSPGAAQHVRLSFDPALPKKLPVRLPAPLLGRSIVLPIQIEGLEAGTRIIADRIEVQLTGPNGLLEKTDSSWDPFAPGYIEQYIEIPSSMRSNPSATVLVSADYWLTLVKETGDYSAPEGDGGISIPALGNCRLSRVAERWQARFVCVKTGPLGGVCLAATGEERKDQKLPVCADYAPGFVWFPNWDAISRTPDQWPPYSGKTGRMSIKTYEVVDHFVRHLDIPNVRLADWTKRQ